MDIDPGPAVWNHPVYRYRVTHRPFGSNGQRLGRMELWLADDKVQPDYVGTRLLKNTYQFTFRMRNPLDRLPTDAFDGAGRPDL